MGNGAIQRVVLELGPGEPIHGTMRDSDREAESFRGWLELAAKLEHLRADRATHRERAETPSIKAR